MPQLPHSVELHDSLLSAVAEGAEALCIKFRPAYVHQNGKGWRQDADLIFANTVGRQRDTQLPCRVSDGTLKTAQGPYHNLLNLPLDDSGPVHLKLELADGTEFQIEGTSARIVLHGAPAFVESFS
jgi:hypothetical protein